MVKLNTIPHKLPKEILRKIKKNKYNEVILFTLGVFGSHKLEDLINDSTKQINDRIDKELFLQTAKNLLERGFITSEIEGLTTIYKATPKGEDEILKFMENTNTTKTLVKMFSGVGSEIENKDSLNVSSISGYKLSYKDIIFGLLSINWRIDDFANAKQEYGDFGTEKNISLGRVIQENAEKFTNNIAIKYEDQVYTYKELNEWVNRYANFFLSLGIKQAEVVNVMLENRPEILFMLGSMSKIGTIGSLINTRQRAATLTHSLTVNKVRFYVVGEELYDAFEEVKPNLGLNEDDKLLFVPDTGKMSTPAGYINFYESVKNQNINNPPNTLNMKGKYTYAYIFTSGTTGLPKAAHIRNIHTRGSMIGWGLLAFHTDPDDVMYVCLPLFHSNAIHIGWASALKGGSAIAIGRRFSATNFWKDCVRYGATCFNYIGEICRYLFNQPPNPLEKQHNVYKIGGNGLRPDIWNEFKERFGIEEVYEHYGMTEMMGMFCNYFNRNKTLGVCFDPYSIVKYDINKDETILSSKGFHQEVAEGEAGLFLLKMRDQYTFAGYTDKNSSKKKILHNVFEEGDAWYNTGDMLRNIGYSHAQFVDRLGDTFRWKGENVSTAEVEEVILKYDLIELSSVYGVLIPETEGRAGMASITLRKSLDEFDFGIFLRLLEKNLPKYAIPKFIRILSEFSTTSTLKIQKSQMKKESFDMDKIEDPMYVLLPNTTEYIPLTIEIYQNIIDKKYQF